MGFARASGVDPGTAGRVREQLQELGFIEARIVREQGAVREYEIRLTALGAEIARHLVAVDDALTRAERKGRKSG